MFPANQNTDRQNLFKGIMEIIPMFFIFILEFSKKDIVQKVFTKCR